MLISQENGPRQTDSSQRNRYVTHTRFDMIQWLLGHLDLQVHQPALDQRAGYKELAPGLGSIAQLHVLADKVSIQVCHQHLGQTGLGFHDQRFRVLENMSQGQSLSLDGREKRFASTAGPQSLDVAGTQIVKELGTVVAGQFDLSAHANRTPPRTLGKGIVLLSQRGGETWRIHRPTSSSLSVGTAC